MTEAFKRVGTAVTILTKSFPKPSENQSRSNSIVFERKLQSIARCNFEEWNPWRRRRSGFINHFQMCRWAGWFLLDYFQYSGFFSEIGEWGSPIHKSKCQKSNKNVIFFVKTQCFPVTVFRVIQHSTIYQSKERYTQAQAWAKLSIIMGCEHL